MAVTIKDIAKRVGKSVTTVSRALHDYDDVSAETKALVRQAAAEMGYTPSSFALRLQNKNPIRSVLSSQLMDPDSQIRFSASF